MSIQLRELVSFCDELLQPHRFKDYCPNGLQVEGTREVERLITGVTASQALIERAIELKAQAILVHHGYFWKGENPQITGMLRKRLKLLLDHDISLLAYHLPLDAHPELGNNAQLARVLDLVIDGSLVPADDPAIGLAGRLPTAMTAAQLASYLSSRLGREPLHIAGPSEEIQTIAWCTGAAQGYINQAADLGVDAFLSGEISEPTVHAARELGIHYFSAGHHATERYGVQALGAYIEQHLGIAHQFVEVPNPV